MKNTFATKIALAIAVTASALFFTSLDAYRTIDKLVADAARESRIQETIALAEQVDSRINKAQDWLQSYLDTGSDDSLREFEKADLRINELLDELRRHGQDYLEWNVRRSGLPPWRTNRIHQFRLGRQ